MEPEKPFDYKEAVYRALANLVDSFHNKHNQRFSSTGYEKISDDLNALDDILTPFWDDEYKRERDISSDVLKDLRPKNKSHRTLLNKYQRKKYQSILKLMKRKGMIPERVKVL